MLFYTKNKDDIQYIPETYLVLILSNSIKNISHETNYYWNDGADVGIDRKGAGREFLHLPLFRTIEHGGKCTV